jgi:hypothetical protein
MKLKAVAETLKPYHRFGNALLKAAGPSGRSLAGIVGLNPAGNLDVYLL